jgi:hypothetical protein
MDPVSLVLVALASGTGQGVADSASDAVKAAYGRLKRLVADRLSGNKSAEVALAEHASDPETWQAPLAKALADTGAGNDESVVAAAQELMALLDEDNDVRLWDVSHLTNVVSSLCASLTHAEWSASLSAEGHQLTLCS